MGFFSLYIRRFARGEPAAAAAAAYQRGRVVAGSARKGVDPEVVESLPAFAYRRECAPADCVICLGEFQEAERVKMIPVCRHVFHVQCVDTWLSSHVSCPLCRGTQFVKAVADVGPAVGRSTVEDGATCAGGLRRSCSSSSLERKGEERPITRTMSF